MAQHQGGVRYLGQLEPMWIFSVWNLLYKKQEFILYTCIAFDTNTSPGHLNIVSDFQFTRPDSLIFRASSEIVEHRFAFCPQHCACMLNNRCTFYQNSIYWYKQ